MKGILILFSLLILGCNRKENVKENPSKIGIAKLEIKNTGAEKPFANPVFMAATNTDFLTFLASLKQNAGIEPLMVYTSAQNKIHHPVRNILALYQNTNLNFEKKLKSIITQNETLFILNYTCNIYATNSLKTITVSVEKDTCRLLLPNNLNDFLK